MYPGHPMFFNVAHKKSACNVENYGMARLGTRLSLIKANFLRPRSNVPRYICQFSHDLWSLIGIKRYLTIIH